MGQAKSCGGGGGGEGLREPLLLPLPRCIFFLAPMGTPSVQATSEGIFWFSSLPVKGSTAFTWTQKDLSKTWEFPFIVHFRSLYAKESYCVVFSTKVITGRRRLVWCTVVMRYVSPFIFLCVWCAVSFCRTVACNIKKLQRFDNYTQTGPTGVRGCSCLNWSFSVLAWPKWKVVFPFFFPAPSHVFRSILSWQFHISFHLLVLKSLLEHWV